jgi:ABC-type nitrate/sulfonate/bicarbonate transport system permease component
VVLVWELLSQAGVLPRFKIPPPSDIAAAAKQLFTVGLPPGFTLPYHAAHSLLRVFCGFGVACAVALPLGILAGRYRWFNAAVDPIVEIVRPIPPLAWLPVAILWFGIGLESAAFIIFIGSFFPILLNTVLGIRLTERVLVEAAQTLGATEWQVIRRVLLPSALPSVVTGMRIGIDIGWMSVVAAEFTGIKSGYGLGYMIMTARDVHKSAAIFAGMIVIGLIGYSIDRMIYSMENRLIPWKKRA